LTELKKNTSAQRL